VYRVGRFDNVSSEQILSRSVSKPLTRAAERQAWKTLRVTTEHQGFILFCVDRFTEFPDAWIQAGRFAGTNRVRLIDSLAVRSMPPMAIEETIAFAQEHLTVESVIDDVRRQER